MEEGIGVRGSACPAHGRRRPPPRATAAPDVRAGASVALGKVESRPPRRRGLPSRGAKLSFSSPPRLRDWVWVTCANPPTQWVREAMWDALPPSATWAVRGQGVCRQAPAILLSRAGRRRCSETPCVHVRAFTRKVHSRRGQRRKNPARGAALRACRRRGLPSRGAELNSSTPPPPTGLGVGLWRCASPPGQGGRAWGETGRAVGVGT